MPSNHSWLGLCLSIRLRFFATYIMLLNRPLSWFFVFTCSITHSALILKIVTTYEYFICSECRDLSKNFSFHCNLCEFQLDVRCASIIDGIKVQRPERSKIEIGIYYFSDPHELIYFNARDILTQN